MVMTTAIPRHGAGGIGRSNSSGGPPWICSSRVGLRKNIRARRSRCLKLEINEGITGSLSENDGERHDGADGSDRPRGQTYHRAFETCVAHCPMHRNHTKADDSYLQQFARAQNHVAVRMAAEHSAQHPTRDREIGRTEKYPGDANRAVSSEAGHNARER